MGFRSRRRRYSVPGTPPSIGEPNTALIIDTVPQTTSVLPPSPGPLSSYEQGGQLTLVGPGTFPTTPPWSPEPAGPGVRPTNTVFITDPTSPLYYRENRERYNPPFSPFLPYDSLSPAEAYRSQMINLNATQPRGIEPLGIEAYLQALNKMMPAEWNRPGASMSVEPGTFRYTPPDPETLYNALAAAYEEATGIPTGHQPKSRYYRKIRNWADWYRSLVQRSYGIRPSIEPLIGWENPERLLAYDRERQRVSPAPPSMPPWAASVDMTDYGPGVLHLPQPAQTTNEVANRMLGYLLPPREGETPSSEEPGSYYSYTYGYVPPNIALTATGTEGEYPLDPLVQLQRMLLNQYNPSYQEQFGQSGIPQLLQSRMKGITSEMRRREAGMGLPGVYTGLEFQQEKARSNLARQAEALYQPMAYAMQQRLTREEQDLFNAIVQAELETRRILELAGRSV